MSNNLKPISISGASVAKTGSAPQGSETPKGNCEVRVTSGDQSTRYEALHAKKGTAHFTKLVELKLEGRGGVQRYWMSNDKFEQFNVQRLMPSTITVSK